MGLSVKGTVACRFDEQEICCYLAFTPDSGVETTLDQVVELLHTNRIQISNNSAVNKIMGEFQGKKEPFETIFTSGIPPEAPEAEHVVWNDFSLPDFVSPYLEDILKVAPLPSVFKKKKETVEVEPSTGDDKKTNHLFKKKSVSPVTRVVETLVPVQVDPQVQQTAYFKKDSVCGSLVAPKPGKPGKSVRGQVVPAPGIKDPSFYIGSGLYRVKDALYAEVSGILRVGQNWADIVPFSKGDYRIEFDSRTNALSLIYEVGDTRFERPSAVQILAEAAGKVLPGQELIDAKEFQKRFTISSSDVGKTITVSLCRDHDSVIEISIAADKTSASLSMQKSVGNGLPLELKNVSAAINQYRFKGLSLDTLKKDIKTFFSGETVLMQDYQLTAGIRPERGENRTVVLKTVPVAEEEKKDLIQRIEASETIKEQFPFALSEADSLSFVKAHQHAACFSAPQIGKSGIDIFGNPIPGLPGNDPVIEVTGDLEIDSDGIHTVSDGLLAVKQQEDTFYAVLVPYRDCLVTVSVAQDELSAWIHIARSVGAGVPLSLGEVNSTLAKFNVTYGIQDEDITKFVDEVNKTGVSGKFCIAHGQQPAAAGSLVITWYVQPNETNARAGITKGTVIASVKRISSESPQQGFTVYGKEIDSQYETAIMDLPHDDSVIEHDNQDGTRTLIAQTNGIVFYTNGFVSVKNERVIDCDIDATVGNIKFNGSLTINGNVLKGHVILADGDICIKKRVEESLVSSNGSVILYDGIQGFGKGIVRARDTIKGLFAEKARLYAGQDIFVKHHCLDCQIKTNTVLHIDSANAVLAGGVVLASKGIAAYDLGSSRGIHTEVSFGQNYLIADQINVTEKEVDKLKLQLDGIDRDLKKMAQMPSTLAAEKIKKLRIMKVTAMKILQQKFLRLFTLREKFELHIPSSVIVKNTVWPGVILESHGRYLEITKPRSSVIFSFDVRSGRILEQPLAALRNNTTNKDGA